MIDNEKSAADPEGRLFFKKRRDGGIVQRYYERKGYGACSLYSKDGGGILYCFSKPLPQEAHEEFRRIITEGQSGDHELRKDLSYLTCWNEDLERVELIAGTVRCCCQIFSDWENFARYGFIERMPLSTVQ